MNTPWIRRTLLVAAGLLIWTGIRTLIWGF